MQVDHIFETWVYWVGPDMSLNLISRRFPIYGYLGLTAIVLAEILLFSGIELIGQFFTPIVWSGYILFVDASVFRIVGDSYLTRRRTEFLFMLPVSIVLWLVFEGYNYFIKNWHYVGLPENLVVRTFGYAWSFATIWPAILETNQLLTAFGLFEKARIRAFQFSNRTRNFLMAVGVICLLVPIIFPSRWWAFLVWTGFIFLLDPLNFRRGRPSFIAEFKQGRLQLFLTLMLSGFICGMLWEFWNYWAQAKWIYSVPILSDVKIFEMPVLGYLGFLAFGLEVFVMWEFVRGLVFKGR